MEKIKRVVCRSASHDRIMEVGVGGVVEIRDDSHYQFKSSKPGTYSGYDKDGNKLITFHGGSYIIDYTEV